MPGLILFLLQSRGELQLLAFAQTRSGSRSCCRRNCAPACPSWSESTMIWSFNIRMMSFCSTPAFAAGCKSTTPASETTRLIELSWAARQSAVARRRNGPSLEVWLNRSRIVSQSAAGNDRRSERPRRFQASLRLDCRRGDIRCSKWRCLLRQGGAKVSTVQEIVFGTPEASVDVHHDRKWTFGLGQTEVSKLIGVGAVGEMGIGWGRREMRMSSEDMAFNLTRTSATDSTDNS